MARRPRTPPTETKPLGEVGPVQHAPPPVVDRYPILLGSNITLQYVSNALRVCSTGYRQTFVDLFDELLERESHSQAMCLRRVQTVAGGRLSIAPAPLPADHPDADLAREIADGVRAHLLALDDLPARIANLAWADILGVSATEALWGQSDGFWPTRLQFVHSRRLSYPDPMTWDLHLWDQGTVTGWGLNAPSQAQPGWGINITRDMPAGKFQVHTPQVRNAYPTREGLGRALVWLMVFKMLGMRQGSQFIERFTKVILWASHSTTNEGKPRSATPEDIAMGKAVIEAMSVGNLAAAILADSIQINADGPALKGSASTMTVSDWVDLCDRQITNLLLGNSFTTDPGKNGSRSASEVGKTGETQGAKFSADMVAATLRRDLALPCVTHNWPGREHLAPVIKIVLDEPNPHAILELSTKAAGSGIPVDADAVAAQVGVPVLAPTNTAGRRMVPVRPQADVPPLDPSAPPPAPAVPPPRPDADSAEDEPADDEPTDDEPGDDAGA